MFVKIEDLRVQCGGGNRLEETHRGEMRDPGRLVNVELKPTFIALSPFYFKKLMFARSSGNPSGGKAQNRFKEWRDDEPWYSFSSSGTGTVGRKTRLGPTTTRPNSLPVFSPGKRKR